MSAATAAMDELIQIIERLRGPDGCPWDREQSAGSMVRFLIEESHELADAIAADRADHVREELGDVLFHVLFIACMPKAGSLTWSRSAVRSVRR